MTVVEQTAVPGARQIAALLDRVEHLEATVKELQRALSVQRNRLDHVEMMAA